MGRLSFISRTKPAATRTSPMARWHRKRSICWSGTRTNRSSSEWDFTSRIARTLSRKNILTCMIWRTSKFRSCLRITRRTFRPPPLNRPSPWPNFGVTREQSRLAQRAYYAAISFVDAQVGRVLAALDRLGLRETTTVVFWSDHGYNTGDHGLWFKQSCFEQAARVPLIIAPPKGAATGGACYRTVEHVDIYPTLADLAGCLHCLRDLQVQACGRFCKIRLRLGRVRPIRKLSAQAATPDAVCAQSAERYTEWDEGRKRLGTLRDHEKAIRASSPNLAGDSRYSSAIARIETAREGQLARFGHGWQSGLVAGGSGASFRNQDSATDRCGEAARFGRPRSLA